MEKGAHSSMLLVNVQIYAMPVKDMLVFYKRCNEVVKTWWLWTTEINVSQFWRPEVHHQAISKAMLSLKLSEKGLLQAFPPASGNS